MSDPLTLRYNNPGAVEFKPWMSQYGGRLGPNGRYAQFDTPDQGYSVMNRILDTYGSKHGLNTVSGIINRWAPANVDNNSTNTYTASVAKALGVDPNAPLTPEQRPGLMKAMAAYEAGRAPAPLNGSSDMPPPMALGGPKPIDGQRPMAQPDQPQGLLSGLSTGLQNIMLNPLFQGGAAMIDAGSRGLNVGAGFVGAADAAGNARKNLLAMENARREMEAKRLRDELWQSLGGDEPPAWAQSMPPGTVQLARSLGPDAGGKFLTDLSLKNAEKGIERDKLTETRRYHDVLADQNRLREEDLKAQREAQQDLLRARAEEIRRQGQAERENAERKRRALEGDTTQPGGVDPNIRPQSFEAPADGPDPNIIKAQVATPPAPAPAQPMPRPQAQPQAVPPGMVQTPRGPMTPEAARTFGQGLLAESDVGLRALGAQILKDADKIRDDGQFSATSRTAIEKDMLGAIDRTATLQRIWDEHGPDIPRWLNMKERGVQAFNAFIDKTTGGLSEQQASDLQKYTAFRASSARALNEVVKELAGSAVTASEAARVLLAEPNAGQGGLMDLFKFDSGNEYITKLRDSLRFSKLAVARYNYLRNARGLTPDQLSKLASAKDATDIGGISLDGMKNVMAREQNRIEGELRQRMQNVPEEDIRNAVRARMKGVFGI